jgi:hypothetical protein
MACSASRCLAAGALLGALACAPHESERELDDPLAYDDALDDDAVDLRKGTFLDPDDDDVPDIEEAEATRDVEGTDDPEAQKACAAGRADAGTHIEADTLMLEAFGYPAGCRGDYARLLHDRYRVTLNTVAGCVVNTWILEHARCYNDAMEAEIARRHGKDALTQVAIDSRCN